MPKFDLPFPPAPHAAAMADISRAYWAMATNPMTCVAMLPLLPLTFGVFLMMNGPVGRSLSGQ